MGDLRTRVEFVTFSIFFIPWLLSVRTDSFSVLPCHLNLFYDTFRFRLSHPHSSGIVNYANKTTFTYWGIKEFLQLIVQPHFDGQSLPDQTHLVRSVFGSEEFLSSLLHFALVAEIHPQSCPVRGPFAVVQCFHSAVHRGVDCGLVLQLTPSSVPVQFTG